ncbi:hypothetical protein IIC65_01290, partial [Candidatus Sumerlaeota bacterium]|nr:hypothetical protein [Candidatus Sumerlaeota bacterium]
MDSPHPNQKSTLEEGLRRLPRHVPPEGLLDRLVADIPEEIAPERWHFAAASLRVSFRWIRTHAALSALALLSACAIGGTAAYRLMSVEEATSFFHIEEDFQLQRAIDAYLSEHGVSPVYFRDLTTPVAYYRAPHYPGWGQQPPLSSKAEVRAYEARSKWAKEPWVNQFSDYRRWEALAENERRDWVAWIVEDWFRAHFVQEKFSPDQKRRVLGLREDAMNQYNAVLPDLVDRQAPKDEFEKTHLGIFGRSVFDPMQLLFKEMRLESPGVPIRNAVRWYRERVGQDPKSLGDL